MESIEIISSFSCSCAYPNKLLLHCRGYCRIVQPESPQTLMELGYIHSHRKCCENQFLAVDEPFVVAAVAVVVVLQQIAALVACLEQAHADFVAFELRKGWSVVGTPFVGVVAAVIARSKTTKIIVFDIIYVTAESIVGSTNRFTTTRLLCSCHILLIARFLSIHYLWTKI